MEWENLPSKVVKSYRREGIKSPYTQVPKGANASATILDVMLHNFGRVLIVVGYKFIINTIYYIYTNVCQIINS